MQENCAMTHSNARILHGDCLELMQSLPDASVDMVLCDLPYGTTACAWDAGLPFDALWAQYRRLCRPGAAVVLTASQPFTSALVMSNPGWFRHAWVWDKKSAANVMNAKHGPLKVHEDVLVFAGKGGAYRPQMVKGKGRWKGGNKREDGIYAGGVPDGKYWSDQYHPKSIIEASNAVQTGKLHPTQKPVALLEYLIRTYTDEGHTVLDNTMGSGSTGVAAINTGRYFVGIERDATYFEVARQRIELAQQQREPQADDLFDPVLLQPQGAPT